MKHRATAKNDSLVKILWLLRCCARAAFSPDFAGRPGG